MQKRNIRSLLTDKDDAMLREIAEEYPVPFDQEKLFQRSYAKFQGTEELPGVKRPLWRRTAFRTLTAAACLILTVGLGVGVWSKQQRIEPIPPQETATLTQTTTAAETRTETTAQTTRAQTTGTQTGSSRTSPERTACRTEAPESTAARSTAVTAASSAPQQTAPVRTAPATAAQTTAAAVTSAAPAVRDTTPSYQTAAMKGTLIVTETAAATPETQVTTVSQETGTVTTAPATSATLDSKEEFRMKAMNIKKMLAVISAAASTSAFSTSPAMTTTAVETVPELTTTVTEFVTQYGDVNLDRDIGLPDLIQLQRFLLGQNDGLGSWMNADLYEDGEIDIYDLAMLKQEILGENGSLGGTVTVKVVDVMTGEPLDSTRVELIGLNETYAYPLCEWNYDHTQEEEQTLHGLPTDPSYTYMINLSNLPAGYGSELGNWDQQYFFNFSEGEISKEVTVYVVAVDEPRNVTIHMKDWALGEDTPYYGLICVTDMDGNPYYPTMHFQDIALPDGAYHAHISPFEDTPLQLLTPDSEYVQRLQEIDPSLTFEDQSMGFDFVVKDGKPDRELRFNFGPKDGKYNHMTVTAQDAYTGQPLAGVHFSLIANPKTDPRVVATWVSDETGSKTFDDLMYSGFPAYKIRVDEYPEGYEATYDQEYHAGYVYDYSYPLTFNFIPSDAEKNFSADILFWEDKSLLNEVSKYEIWRTDNNDAANSVKLYEDVVPGTKVALEDGDYFAALTGLREAAEMGYDTIRNNSYGGISTFEKLGLSTEEFMYDTGYVNFTIRDGKPDRPVVFYLKKYDPADYEVPPEVYEYWDKVWEENMHSGDSGETSE